MSRWKCTECARIFDRDKLLEGVNPFASGGTIVGCPYCKTVEQFERSCDVEGCSEPMSSGHPTTSGYLFTCYKHRNRNSTEADGGGE